MGPSPLYKSAHISRMLAPFALKLIILVGVGVGLCLCPAKTPIMTPPTIPISQALEEDQMVREEKVSWGPPGESGKADTKDEALAEERVS
jgi:hypothetical protein